MKPYHRKQRHLPRFRCSPCVFELSGSLLSDRREKKKTFPARDKCRLVERLNRFFLYDEELEKKTKDAGVNRTGGCEMMSGGNHSAENDI